MKSLKGKGKIEEDDLKQALRQVRLAMIEADVNLGVVKDFINNIKEKANRPGNLRELESGTDGY